MKQEERCSFELFKSNVCHELKRKGDIQFMIDLLNQDEITIYYEKQWYPESFYLLAMLDYLSRIYDVPLYNKYDRVRCQKLECPIYPSSVEILDEVNKNDKAKQKAKNEAIPEFLRYNIIESDIRNVI